MKLTQAITNWLHKMFAWWPWKESTQTEYAPYSSSLNKGTTQESMSKSIHESTTPQTGIAPSLSTIQEWPERVIQTDVNAKNELSRDGESMTKPATPADETPASMQASPSTQQRLEFLQYLVKHGIVNEGLDDDR
jgi:hypothetical protein